MNDDDLSESYRVSEWVQMSDRRSKHIIWIVFLFQIEQALIVRPKQAEHAPVL